MPLSREEVKHIALLARVGVTDEDVERFRAQLSVILEHFETLSAVDTDGVPPTAQSLPLQNVKRDDLAGLSLERARILANAPQTEGGYIRVRRVLE